MQKFAIPPQEKMTKLGWKIYANFSKVKQSDKLSMLSQKKKNVPNSAKIMGECFAEFLFYGPARPGGPWPGLPQNHIFPALEIMSFCWTPIWCWPNVLLGQARIRAAWGPMGLPGPTKKTQQNILQWFLFSFAHFIFGWACSVCHFV